MILSYVKYSIVCFLRCYILDGRSNLCTDAAPGQLSADEVALEWDNAWHVAKGLCEERVITVEIYNAVTHLNHELGAIEPYSNFWSDEVLQYDDRWENFCIRAQSIVAQLTAMQVL